MNKKEMITSLKEALSMTSSVDLLKKKYMRLKDLEITKVPFVIDSKVLELKSKDFLGSMEKILQKELYEVAIQKKEVRAGKGKMRGRKYKSNAGMLLVIGDKETKKIKGIDVRTVKDLSVTDLAANGARLTLYTEDAINDLGAKFKWD